MYLDFQVNGHSNTYLPNNGSSAMASHRLSLLWLIVAAGILSLTSLPSAHAVPSYARQTGQQ